MGLRLAEQGDIGVCYSHISNQQAKGAQDAYTQSILKSIF